MYSSIYKKIDRISAALLIALCLSLFTSVPDSFSADRSTEREKISINFVDVEISSIVKIMSELTGKNFIFDDAVKGKVTIIAPMKLSEEEALTLFTSALELKKYTIITAGKAYKVIPLTQARQSAAKVLKQGEDRGGAIDSYIVRLVPLDYISTQEAFTLVQPLISRYGQLSIFGARNALLVVDSVANTEKVLSIIASVDTEPMTEEPELVYLKHTKAETVAELLRIEARVSGLGAYGTGGGKGTAGGITPDIRLNAIILSLPVKARENIKKFIAVLDTPATESSSRVHVYYLENAEATELSRVLNQLIKSNPDNVVKDLSTKMSITPDKTTNSLIIMASPADYQGIVHVIQKLDRRPKQVFVETMITEVSIGKALELGTKWRVTGVSDGEPIVIGGFGTIDQSEIQKIISGMAGLSIGGLGNFITVPVTRADGTTFNLSAPGFAALFSLSDFRDTINVLSTPHILTSDNSEAEIIIGENVPFLSSIEREATTTNQPLLQSIERKDVGITLRIKPKISEGDFVKLDLYQEISAIAIATTTVSGAADLITTKRSAKTTVVVKDKQTVVIGGLIQTQKVKNVTKIPILGDIPILNLLFKFTSTQDEKTNLLIFITPHIIDDFDDLEKLRSKKESEYNEDSTIGLPEKKGIEESVPDAEMDEPTGRIDKESSAVPAALQAAEPLTSPEKAVTEPKKITVNKQLKVAGPKIAKTAAARQTTQAKETSQDSSVRAGQTINIEPTAAIRKIRTGRHIGFHRLVIELTRPAGYTIERTPKSATIKIVGATDGGQKASHLSTKFISFSDPAVTWSRGKEKEAVTVLKLSHLSGSRIKTFALEKPYRIVVDVYRNEE